MDWGRRGTPHGGSLAEGPWERSPHLRALVNGETSTLMVTEPSCGRGPVSVAQGCRRLVAGVPWSEEQGLAAEAGPHSASRHHVRPAVGGP